MAPGQQQNTHKGTCKCRSQTAVLPRPPAPPRHPPPPPPPSRPARSPRENEAEEAGALARAKDERKRRRQRRRSSEESIESTSPANSAGTLGMEDRRRARSWQSESESTTEWLVVVFRFWRRLQQSSRNPTQACNVHVDCTTEGNKLSRNCLI